jgi:hypothetical protein
MRPSAPQSFANGIILGHRLNLAVASDAIAYHQCGFRLHRCRSNWRCSCRRSKLLPS